MGTDGEDARPSVARMYDYYLGGAHNFGPDRAAADQVAARLPHVATWARANRGFLRRVVRYCVGHGVTQFLDLGSGIPTMGNVHEVARALDPRARVAYVDIDPVAVANARELLGGIEGVSVTRADIRRPDDVLAAPSVREVLDLSRPVALLMVAVLHFLEDSEGLDDLVATYRGSLAPGSYLAFSHVSADYDDPDLAARMRAAEEVYQRTASAGRLRDRAALRPLLHGTTLVEPGLVDVNQWRSEQTDAAPLGAYGALARLPGPDGEDPR